MLTFHFHFLFNNMNSELSILFMLETYKLDYCCIFKRYFQCVHRIFCLQLCEHGACCLRPRSTYFQILFRKIRIYHLFFWKLRSSFHWEPGGWHCSTIEAFVLGTLYYQMQVNTNNNDLVVVYEVKWILNLIFFKTYGM